MSEPREPIRVELRDSDDGVAIRLRGGDSVVDLPVVLACALLHDEAVRLKVRYAIWLASGGER